MRATNDLKVDLRRTVADLRRLVVEIRQEVGAAKTDARKRWKDFLGPQLTRSETLMRELAEVSRMAVQSTAAAFRELKGRRKAPGVRRSRLAADGTVGSRRQRDSSRAHDLPG
jgi:hypothetical protein